MATIVAGPPRRPKWYAAGGAGGAGALLGLKIAGPVGAAAGALVGALGGYFLESKVSALVHKIVPASFQALAGGGTPAPVQTTAAQVASSGIAKGAANALYAYLKVHGPDGTSDLAQLVSTFQSQSNSDPAALGLTGPLSVSAVYDPKTSAALTLYTHDPIPASTPPAPGPPPSPTQIADIYLPGAAATSGFNLYTYLKAHGNKPSDASLQKLVHQFQIDVNTDPKFPGPSAIVGNGILKIMIPNRLPETGVYDAPTSTALTVMSNDAIRP